MTKKNLRIFILGVLLVQFFILSWYWPAFQHTNTAKPITAGIDNYTTNYNYWAGLYQEGWAKLPNHGTIAINGGGVAILSVLGDCNYDSDETTKAPMMQYYYVENMKAVDCPDGTYSVVVSTASTSIRVNYGLFLDGSSYDYLWCVTEQSGTVTLDKINSNSYIHNDVGFTYTGTTIELLFKKSGTTFQVGIKSSDGTTQWSGAKQDTIHKIGLIAKGWKDFWGNYPSLTINFGRFLKYEGPSAPGISSVSQVNTAIHIAWTVPSNNGGSDVTQYTLYRSTGSGGFSIINSPAASATSYIDNGPFVGGVTYNYKMTATNEFGTSPDSNLLSTTFVSVPTYPLNPTVFQLNNHQLILSWAVPSSNGGECLDYYQIQRSVGTTSGFINYGTTPEISYTDSGTSNGTVYYYRILAHNSKGFSAASAIVSALARDNPAPAESTNLLGAVGSISLGNYSTIVWRIQDNTVTASAASYRFTYTLNGGSNIIAYASSTWNGLLAEFSISNSIYGSASRIQIETYVNDGQGQAHTSTWDLQIVNEIPEVRYGTLVPQGEPNGNESQTVYVYDPSWNAVASMLKIEYRSKMGNWQTHTQVNQIQPNTNFEIPFTLFNAEVGEYELRVSVQDGFGQNNVLIFTVNIVNSGPIITVLNLWAFEEDVQTSNPHKNAVLFAYAVIKDSTPGEIPAVTFEFCQIDGEGNWWDLGAEITVNSSENGVYLCCLQEILPNFELEHFTKIGVRCFATDGNSDSLVAFSNILMIENMIPTVLDYSIEYSSSPTENQLRAVVETEDLDGDECVIQYRWYKQSAGKSERLISGATADQISNNLFTHGDLIRNEIRVGNIFENTEFWSPWYSGDVYVVPNSLPVISTVQIPLNITNNLNVIPIIAVSDCEDMIALEYKWTVNDVVQATAFSLSKSLYKHGDRIQLSVRANDDYEPLNKTEWVISNEVIVGNNLPILNQVEVTPEIIYMDDQINVTASGSDPDGDQIRFWCEFYVNGKLVQNGTNQKLNASLFKGGDTVFCIVYAFDSYDPTAFSQPLQTESIIVKTVTRFDGIDEKIFTRMNLSAWMVCGGSFLLVFVVGLIRFKLKTLEAQ